MSEERLFVLMRRVRKLELITHPLGDSTVSPTQIALQDWIASSPGRGVQDIADDLWG